MNSAKKRHVRIRVFVEILLFASLPALADLAMGGEVLYRAYYSAPYALAFPLLAIFYPFFPAFLGAMLSWAEGAALGYWYCMNDGLNIFDYLPPESLHTLAGGLILALLASFVRNRLLVNQKHYIERYKAAVHQLVKLEKRIKILERVHQVLENRVSSQKDSITLLHDRVKKLASLNLDEALTTLLDTIALFTGMEIGEIWRLDNEQNQLVPAAVYGWPREERQEASRNLDASIEGYVFRNKQLFSVRMLLNSAEFDRFDSKKNILTFPIIINGKPWGVLNIQKLPFEQYSRYTESILEILLSLAEPYLRNIIEYENLQNQQDLDPVTGYPLFSLLYKNLEDDLERARYEGGSVSLIIMEVINFNELAEKVDRNQLRRMLFQLKELIDETKRIKTKAFHYKDDNQIALLVYGLDHDGASFFCLDVLALLSEYSFEADGQKYPVELILGFSTSTGTSGTGGTGSTADSLVAEAEHLLSVQRL
ncbi:GAF domain-containing protein [Gracilinema caldarium]|uniref:GAF domain-containing protein n=1 Tax=Gracilinema caldarium TaxID=215591 RepID=UPI0026F21E5C|nr:GAF domain-containing protein [Gracilinema caldarium]